MAPITAFNECVIICPPRARHVHRRVNTTASRCVSGVKKSGLYLPVSKERDDEIIEGVGRRIAEARKAKAWTQQKAADRLKIEVQSWQRFERGENTTIRTLVKIANLFGVTTRSLFDEPTSREHREGRPRRS
jgi:ribosome-binding protein aMBF1 (putative translation factor)